MAENVVVRIRDWVEPAHPAVIRLYTDLLEIYKKIREVAQKEIDTAFHSVSRQIGYVVAATIPVTFEIGDQGAVKTVTIGADHLKGTLFERELLAPLKRVDKIASAAPGTYKVYVIWTDALKVKLRKDWIEPAHFVVPSLFDRYRVDVSRIVPPEVHEPVHWFDPGLLLSAEDAVLISVIDEVYPEIRLAERVALTREALRRKVFPEVMEPVHIPGGREILK
jgi:hypothetical protein